MQHPVKKNCMEGSAGSVIDEPVFTTLSVQGIKSKSVALPDAFSQNTFYSISAEVEVNPPGHAKSS